MKTFIYESKKYKFKNTEEANDKLPLGNGVWDTREPGAYACAHNGQYKMNTTHKAWVKGNFFDQCDTMCNGSQRAIVLIQVINNKGEI